MAQMCTYCPGEQHGSKLSATKLIPQGGALSKGEMESNYTVGVKNVVVWKN